MPHIVIEHDREVSNEISLVGLANDLHHTLSQQETVKLESIKTRTVQVENVIVADGRINKMVHVQVYLLPGRDNKLKERMAKALYETASKNLAGIKCKLSIHISELQVYIKN